MRLPLQAFFAAAAFALAGCTQTATNLPPSTPVDPYASNALQFAVGVATISAQGQSKQGLNVVETLRQQNGLSGTLFNVPAITGPAGFSISAPSISSQISPPIQTLARADYQTNRITQQTFDTQQATGYNTNNPLTAVPSTGAFGYGLCPCNANSGPINGSPQLYHAQYLPLYAVLPFGNYSGGGGQFEANLQYYGGPPAFPAPPAELVQAGFTGYSIGFTDFAVAPVIGTYRMDVAIPPDFYTTGSTPTPQPSPSASPVPTLSATAKLTSLTGLPAFPAPQFKTDVSGGGTILLDVPAGVTETLAFLQEGQGSTSFCNGAFTSPIFYTFLVRGSGVQAVTVPDNIGPSNGPTLCQGAPYFVYAAGFDYPAFEAAYPQSASQNPVITNSVIGQADVTTSDAGVGVY